MLRVVSGAAILFEHACSDGSIRFGSILYCVLCVCTKYNGGEQSTWLEMRSAALKQQTADCLSARSRIGSREVF
jgi:hypothetical protein